jgi:hypothetical protein
MQNAYKKPDALKLFISAIFRRATKTNTRWFNTDYVEEKCEEFVLLSEQKPKKALRKIWPLLAASLQAHGGHSSGSPDLRTPSMACKTRQELRRSDGCLAHLMPPTPGLGGCE